MVVSRSLTMCTLAVLLLSLQCILNVASAYSERRDKTGAHYAPDRKADIIHMTLDVTPDFQKRTVKGEVALRFKPIAKELDELRLNAEDLDVAKVASTAAIAGYQVTDKEIVVTFVDPIPAGKETTLTIDYSAQPTKGLYFRVPSNGYKASDEYVFSQGEMIEARHWFPCYDSPNEKYTSEVTCHVPEGMTVISNGKQVSSVKDPASGLVAVKWLQDKPHVTYLITLAAGYFSKLEDKYKDIPLSFYTVPSDKKEAPLAFADTKPIMQFYEKEIGVDYPWDKYGQVVVQDFTYGGMENTSLTTLSETVLRPAEIENVKLSNTGEYTSEEIIAHEMAHQWFGDLVTIKDWSHTWLNEGFATFYALLYLQDRYGREQFLYNLYVNSENIISRSKDESRPIVFRHYHDPVEQFDQRAYQRGAWVLHMLRSQLGDDLFRNCIKTYVERNKFQNVVSSDLNKVVEELSGRSFDQFFDEWIYNAGVPDLVVRYSWDEKTKLARVSVSQQKSEDDNSRSKNSEQEKSENKTYHFPLTVSFRNKGESTERHVQVKEAEESFYFPLKKAPDVVRIDPNLELLADVKFQISDHMLYAQLADKTDMVGRLIACDELADRKDDNTIAKLKDVLQNDPFYGVRERAATSLRKIHTEAALDALIASTTQPDARARNAVVLEIGKFYNPLARDALLKTLDKEQNPAIVATALKGLRSYHTPQVHEILLKYLSSNSYHNMIADAAIAAISSQDDQTFIAPLKAELSKREADFTSYGFSEGLDTLAYIDRNEKPRDDVRNFIAGYLNHKREAIQIGAIKALGSLEDPKSIALLQTFASSSKESPQQQEAEWAISSLRRVNKPNDNLQDLRQEVLDLQKENRDLRKDFEDLKKRITASDSKKKSDKKPEKKSEPKSEKSSEQPKPTKPQDSSAPKEQKDGGNDSRSK